MREECRERKADRQTDMYIKGRGKGKRERREAVGQEGRIATSPSLSIPGHTKHIHLRGDFHYNKLSLRTRAHSKTVTVQSHMKGIIFLSH